MNTESCSILPNDESEWPFREYLIYRYPSTTEFCEYDGTILRSQVRSGSCIRAIYLTYICSRFRQLLEYADYRHLDFQDNKGFKTSFEINRRGCISSKDLEQMSINLKYIRWFYMVYKSFVSVDIESPTIAYEDLDDAENKAIEDIDSVFNTPITDVEEWDRPRFNSGDCLHAEDIASLVSRANSLKCGVSHRQITEGLEFFFERYKHYHGYADSTCPIDDYVIEENVTYLGAFGSQVPTIEADSDSIPEDFLSVFFGSLFEYQHGYAVRVGKILGNAHQSCEVSWTILCSMHEYQSGSYGDDIHEYTRSSDCYDDDNPPKKCGSSTYEERTWTPDNEHHNTYKIITITVTGRTTEIDGYLYAITPEELAKEMQVLIDVPPISDFGTISFIRERGSASMCCPAFERTCMADPEEPIETHDYEIRLTEGKGTSVKGRRLKVLREYVQVKPCFLSLD